MKTLFRFLIILASFILALLAKSFLGQISLLGLNLNLVFILVFILSLSSSKKNWGLEASVWGGLFLDSWTVGFFGSSILILALVSYLTKKASRSIQTTLPSKIILFILAFIIYLLINQIIVVILTAKIWDGLQILALFLTLVSNLLGYLLLTFLGKLLWKNNFNYASF